MESDLTEGGLGVSPNENSRRAEAFRALIATAPQPGTNTILITHKPNIIEALGKDWFDVKEGEASIFCPENGHYTLNRPGANDGLVPDRHSGEIDLNTRGFGPPVLARKGRFSSHGVLRQDHHTRAVLLRRLSAARMGAQGRAARQAGEASGTPNPNTRACKNSALIAAALLNRQLPSMPSSQLDPVTHAPARPLRCSLLFGVQS